VIVPVGLPDAAEVLAVRTTFVPAGAGLGKALSVVVVATFTGATESVTAVEALAVKPVAPP
jgi:uncharacterized protein (DUF58 family)